ncbi:MAG: tetratricopeptide repeat protein [Spirochaetes bacterium]|nr:tetratricopeptide repeat protein [Spirochaetota bacterium]
MKFKIANRFSIIKKNNICSRIILFAGIFFVLNLHGHSGVNNYAPDITNPFHDVFNLYFNNLKKEAVNLLKKQFKNKRLKSQAYINYGLIQEFESNYAEAEKYYRMALSDNEKTAVLYLYNFYKNYDKEKIMPLLLAVQKNENNYWILYEQAVFYIENSEKDKAFDCLSEAVDKGFSSADLLFNDPAFNEIKNTIKFKWIVHKSKKNYSKSASITQKSKESDYEYKKDKPYDINADLITASELEKAGNEKQALNILTSLLKSKLSFRDRSIALFWSARLSARTGREKKAEQYLREFNNHISGQEKDETGYRDLITLVYKDIISNAESLKRIAGE